MTKSGEFYEERWDAPQSAFNSLVLRLDRDETGRRASPQAGGAIVGESLALHGGRAERTITRSTVERGNRSDSIHGERRSREHNDGIAVRLRLTRVPAGPC